MAKRLDLITIGRSSVDLYGAQVGAFWKIWPPSTNMSAALRPILQQEQRDSVLNRRLLPAWVMSIWGASCCVNWNVKVSIRAVLLPTPNVSPLLSFWGFAIRNISSYLLSRELCRYGSLRRRYRPGFHRGIRLLARHRYASVASAHRSSRTESAAACPRKRKSHSPRY